MALELGPYQVHEFIILAYLSNEKPHEKIYQKDEWTTLHSLNWPPAIKGVASPIGRNLEFSVPRTIGTPKCRGVGATNP